MPGRLKATGRSKPLVVQHSFGAPGSGGPVGALERLLESPLSATYDFVRLHQDSPNGLINFARIARWRSMLVELRPDLVHVRGLGNEGFHAALAARLANCPRILVSIHGTVRDLRIQSVRTRVLAATAEPATLFMASHITTVSKLALQRPFLQRYRRKLIGPISNGVGLPPPGRRLLSRRALAIGEEDFVITAVGRLTAEKGHYDLAAALARASAALPANSRLLVIGDGPESDAIAERYSATGFPVTFLGRRLDVPELLAAADLFVLPSWHENLSNALLEAMAEGLPVVATAVGDSSLLLKGSPLVVPPHQPDALADAIVKAAVDAELRTRLGNEAREMIEREYSLDAMARSVDAAYRTVLGDAWS